MAQDQYNEHAKKYFSTHEDFKLDRVRNYFSPIKTYFEILSTLNNEKLSEEKRKGLKDILEQTEHQCHENVSKIQEILKSDNTNNS